MEARIFIVIATILLQWKLIRYQIMGRLIITKKKEICKNEFKTMKTSKKVRILFWQHKNYSKQNAMFLVTATNVLETN